MISHVEGVRKDEVEETLPHEIRQALRGHSRIPREKVREWMGSRDLNIQGAVNALLMEEESYLRVQPPLEIVEYSRFFTAYTQRCLLEDPNEEWTDSRFAAGLNWVHFFVSLFEDEDVPGSETVYLKEWLARIYRESDRLTRLGLVTAVLEYLFEVRAIAEFFSDWQEDPALKEAYDMALEYGKEWWDREAVPARKRRS